MGCHFALQQHHHYWHSELMKLLHSATQQLILLALCIYGTWEYPKATRCEFSCSHAAWLGLFTWELVLDLSAVTFIWCLKRFAARRGLPRRIVSDNAKTFKATAKAIDSMLKDRNVQNYLFHVGVNWVFNPEKVPWWGGMFARWIKSTKRCLQKLIGQARFSYDEMHTAVVEIEAIINLCPLTYVSYDRRTIDAIASFIGMENFESTW